MTTGKLDRKDCLTFVFLSVLCILAYHGLVNHYFWEDDFLHIEMGKEGLDLFGSVFGFRPIDRLFFFLNYRLTGPGPVGYNVFSIAVHLLNSILLYILMRMIFENRLLSFSAAALFVTTNTHSDAVFWVSARTGLFSFALLLLSLIFWTRYRKADRPGRMDYGLSLFFMSLAFFAKEEAVVYPLLLVLTDRLFLHAGKDSSRDTWVKYAGFFIVLLVYLGFQAFWQHSLSTRSVNIKSGIYALGINSPVNLLEIFLYFFSPSFIVFKSHQLVLAFSAGIIACLLAAGYLTGHKKEALWAVLWIFISFFPMSFFRWDLIATVEGAFIRRYFYTPSIGAVFILGLFVNWLYNVMKRTRLAATVSCLVLLAMLGWNLMEINKSEKGWDKRTGHVRSEVTAIKDLYPALPPGKAGFFLRGFVQKELFNKSMLTVLYDKSDIVLYGREDAGKMLESNDLAFKAALWEKDGYVLDYSSNRSVPLSDE